MASKLSEFYKDGAPVDPIGAEWGMADDIPKPRGRESKKAETPAWMTAVQKMDDFMRATGNAMTFGLTDKLAGITEDNPAARTAAARERSPYTSIAGDVIGTVAPAGAISKTVGLGVKALGKASIPSIIGNQAVTGGLMSAADDVAHGELPDPKKAAIGTAVGGVTGAVVPTISRLSPSSRIRASGMDFTPNDKAAARAFATKAENSGVKLTLPEVMEKVAPGRQGRLQSTFDNAAGHETGAVTANNFQDARLEHLNTVLRNVASNFGPGVKDSTVARDAAGSAIRRAEKLVSNSAEPYYKQAGPVFAKNPKTESIKEATKQVMDDPVKMAEMGKAPPQSIKFLDTVKKQLDTNYARASGSDDAFRAGIIKRDAEALRNNMDTASPIYKTARGIFEDGTEKLVEPLKAGPLGTMTKNSNVQTQAKSLLDVATPEAKDVSINAVKRLGAENPAVPPGLLSAHINDAASRNGMKAGNKLFPTEEGLAVAREMGGPNFGRVEDTIDAVRSVNPRKFDPSGYDKDHHSPFVAAWRKITDTGSGQAVQRMLTPEMIEQLGTVGSVQQLLQLLATGAGAKAISNRSRSGRE